MKLKFFTTIIFAGLGIVIQAQDLESNLVASYSFNSNANNQSGVAVDGDVHGATLTTDRNGNEDQAYAFDGASYIEIAGNDTAFNINPNGYTISLWAYPNSEQLSSSNVLLGFGRDSHNGWCLRYLSAIPRFDFMFYSGDSYGSSRKYVYIDPDQWIHYVWVYKDGYMHMYIDGKQILKEYCPEYNYANGYNLVIGASSSYGSGFSGKIDEVKIYKRALSFLEVATLAENESAIDAARKGTAFHADFERNILDAEQVGCGVDAENGGSVTVTQNPKKDAVNSSDFVMIAKTIKSTEDSHTRAEFFSKWDEGFETKNKTHIFQWMVYFPEDYLAEIDTIRGAWQVITQFVTHPCARYEDGFEDAICGGGGIFNELRINKQDYNEYRFEYRAWPDCNEVSFKYPKGEWIKFTYQIYWTTESKGFYRVWANETLLGEAYDVRTLPEGWREGECDLRWKVGLYDSWYDEETDSVYYYADNLEIYIDKDINEVCPHCSFSTSINDRIRTGKDSEINLFPIPSTGQVMISGLNQQAEIFIYNMNGIAVKQTCAESSFSISEVPAGIYFIEIYTDKGIVVKRIVKK